ncbi:MAG: AMP-binding protein [Pseudomonadota bacterium]|nr:AMP-binding protein [Pseudomonadota bacterium]
MLCGDIFKIGEIEQSIPQRFAQQVLRHGDRLAIVTPDGRVTYDALDRASNQVAHALEASPPLGDGDCIAVLLEPGIAQIAAILGVLKSGRIYVPLDPALPRRRLSEILDDAAPRTVLTDRVNASLARLLGGDQRQILDVAGDVSSFPTAALAKTVAPDAQAYIYYTSGTTGSAKGVVDDHRNVLHNIARYTNNLRVTHEDRLTLLQSCGFSGAVSNIFTALLNGATLLPFDVRAEGPAALARWLAAQRPTIYHSVPSLFRHVMACGVALPSLRVVRLEGDLARAIDVATFNRHFDARCVLANGLGATETGISAQYLIEHGTGLDGQTVPVGHATQDMRIDVVDESGRPVPAGTLGEVVVTSRYLARGYWRRPDLSAAAFRVIDGDVRAYHTRDLGRIDAAGRLECHGRIDQLVKLRGEWVDLRAIEQSLAQCDGVADAIASVVDDRDGNFRLVAHVVGEGGATPTAARLRDALRALALPPQAMPSRFVVLDRWPLDRHGKLDRDAFAAATEAGRSGAAPQTPAQRLVAEVFSQTLGVPAVSVADDFFELGGDSLHAVEASIELGRRTGSEVALGAFQHASTVQALAAVIDGVTTAGSLVPLQPQGTARPVFCVHAHMGHVFNLRELARQFAPERPFYGLQAKGLDGIERPEMQLEAMAAGYFDEIRRVQPIGPYLVAGYCFGSWVAIEVARRLLAHGEDVDALLLIAPSLPASVAPSHQGASTWQRCVRMWKWMRRATPRSVRTYLRDRSTLAIDEALVRLLWHASNRGLADLWPFSRALRRPAAAIAFMSLGYRPEPYAGAATVFLTAGAPLDEASRQAWTQLILGRLEFVPLAGDARDVMRPPYARDVAVCILARLP